MLLLLLCITGIIDSLIQNLILDKNFGLAFLKRKQEFSGLIIPEHEWLMKHENSFNSLIHLIVIH